MAYSIIISAKKNAAGGYDVLHSYFYTDAAGRAAGIEAAKRDRAASGGLIADSRDIPLTILAPDLDLDAPVWNGLGLEVARGLVGTLRAMSDEGARRLADIIQAAIDDFLEVPG